VRRDIEMRVLLMNPTEGVQIGPRRCAGPFSGGAEQLTLAIVIIPRPPPHTMAQNGMRRMATPMALPLIGVECHTANGAARALSPIETSAAPSKVAFR
jgi:hypothetical protein